MRDTDLAPRERDSSSLLDWLIAMLVLVLGAIGLVAGMTVFLPREIGK